uniref:Uncharacterized protein n=1 Tax=Lutzomyia longipalpis TaxID=7200 RepID=A0A7G3B074_LUTLO
MNFEGTAQIDPQSYANSVQKNVLFQENASRTPAGQLGPRRLEIRQRLNSYGITTDSFPEFSQHTRFDLKYALSLSDIIGKQETFKLEKVQFGNMTLAGGDTQVIFTKPSNEAIDLQTRWTDTTVQATSASSESTAQMGASYVFGFQLYKEEGDGNDATTRSKRWSCIERDTQAEAPWSIPQPWINSRNMRRNVPEGVGTERFRSISKRQDFNRSSVVRLMIKTNAYRYSTQLYHKRFWSISKRWSCLANL